LIASANWQVPHDRAPYVLDVDVLARIHVRKDLEHIYNSLVVMAENGRVRTVRQTFDELKRFNPVHEILKTHRDKFQISTADQFCSPVQKYIEVLGNEASYLANATGGRNPDPADPWIVAVGPTYGYTVVTNESPRSLYRIPAACRLPAVGCRCIRGPHFLIEVGIVTEIKPEHIDPAFFFEKGE
jgi:hypothetical protein